MWDETGILKEQLEDKDATIAGLQAEVERLKETAMWRGMVSEMADMAEVAVLVCGLHDRIKQLEYENKTFKEWYQGRGKGLLVEEIKKLREENSRLATERDDQFYARHIEKKNTDLLRNEVKALRSRLKVAEGKVEMLINFIPEGFPMPLGWMQLVKQVRGEP